MKLNTARLSVLGLLGAASLLSLAESAPDQGLTEEPLRVRLDLKDGSQVIGVPRFNSLPIHSPYYDAHVPLERLWKFSVSGDGHELRMDFPNQDVLRGTSDMSELSLTTLFGDIHVAISDVACGRILGGKRSGPVLHYGFDADDLDRVLDLGSAQVSATPVGNIAYVRGKHGRAITTRSKDTYVAVSGDHFSVKGWSAVTVSTWFKLDGLPTYGKLVDYGREAQGGGFSLTTGGMLGSRVIDGHFNVVLDNKQSAMVKFRRYAEMNTWYHTVGVYDGETVACYVNGEMLAMTRVPQERQNLLLYHEEGMDLCIGKSASRRDWLDTHINGAIDDVIIYDRALSAHEIKTLYTSQASTP
jgi:hypothetical protein